jgi:hypothetical protein
VTGGPGMLENKPRGAFRRTIKPPARTMRMATRRASAPAAEDQRASLISIRDRRSFNVAQIGFWVAGKDLLLLSTVKDFECRNAIGKPASHRAKFESF